MGKDEFILRAEGLHKSYRMGATEVKVLKGVDLAVKRGEFVAIVGASGSGKSTLLHILGALDRPDKVKQDSSATRLRRFFCWIARFLAVLLGIGSAAIVGISILTEIRTEWAAIGEGFEQVSLIWVILAVMMVIFASLLTVLISGVIVYYVFWFFYRLIDWLVFWFFWRLRRDKGAVMFEGRDLSRFSGRKLNRFRNKMVGFVFQFYHLLDELSVLENVFLPAMASCSVLGWLFAGRRRAIKRAKELLEQLGLSDRLKHKPYQLSGGERQRVAIGRALMNEPRLLLADEPTGNLDSETGNGILDIFENLNRAGQTIIMVTHDERIAQRAGRIITLRDGKISV